jgi:hypothetical protein
LRASQHLSKAVSASRRSRLAPVTVLFVVSASVAAVLAGGSSSPSSRALVSRQPDAPSRGTDASFAAVRATARKLGKGVILGHSLKNDTSRPLRDLRSVTRHRRSETETVLRNPLAAAQKPSGATTGGVVQRTPSASKVPAPSQTFEGIDYPGVACNCLPPDTDGEIGQTEYVQVVNDGFEVFNKSGTPLYGPADIATIWSGFGGDCELNGQGDPIVLYDQLANRWLISQFAGADVPTEECIAVSQTNDATGSWNRYDFHLGDNFYDYPKLGVWPDAYYQSDFVFDSTATSYLGPQPFAFNRAAMLAGAPATFITTGVTAGPTEDPYLPADIDGSKLPPAGAPEPFVEWPGVGAYKVYHFHVDWTNPAGSTFTLAGAPPAASFSVLCSGTRDCVPQPGTLEGIDAIGDRLMARAAYRNFGDHDSLVGNYTVSSGDLAAVRWFELRHVTSGAPTVAQQSTYQPDSTWRWMGSDAMDKAGDLALGFSASSSTTFPSIRYAARLYTDPTNTLAQGEKTMFAGGGSQTHPAARWGDYSAMSVDPTDDCTFWYTNEYYSATSERNWQTRIGSFKLPQCANGLAKCVVPKVIGLSLAKAKVKITKAHCRVGKVTKKHSTKKKKGKVIKESPKAGKKLALNSKVNLTLGKG